jgi:2',3'-cyclic-nucleotide 2'-phosphodiesterase (5'-nucleotidase family)
MRRMIPLVLLLVLAAPVRLGAAAEPGVQTGHHLVNDSVAPDSGVEAFLSPMRAELERQVGEVLGEATALLDEGKPESPLGNLVADIMREAAAAKTGAPVEVALTNVGGLRAPIPAGPVTRRTIIEVMPFDNKLFVLTLKGDELRALAREIAARGGAPQSGLEIVLHHRALVSVTVAGAPIDPTRAYRVVTTDYLYRVAQEGSALKADATPIETGILLRDAIIDAVRARRTLSPAMDGRTRGK